MVQLNHAVECFVFAKNDAFAVPVLMHYQGITLVESATHPSWLGAVTS